MSGAVLIGILIGGRSSEVIAIIAARVQFSAALFSKLEIPSSRPFLISRYPSFWNSQPPLLYNPLWPLSLPPLSEF
jgi:hypothetical protein